MKVVIGFVFIILFAACSHKSLVDHSNAYQKLRDALYLYKYKNRPLLAEKLIFQAMQKFQAHDNQRGLCIAYRDYAFYLQSKSLTLNLHKIKKHGFRDQEVTFENRFVKALEYFERSIEILKSLQHSYDLLTNLYLSKGFALHYHHNDKTQACQALHESLKAHQQHQAFLPHSRPVVPKGYESYKAYIERVKKEFKCKK